MRSFKYSLIISLLLGCAVAMSQPKERVMIAEQSFAGSKAVSYILKAVIEKRLGGQAEVKLADTSAAVAALDKGDGQLDVIGDFWMPNHNARWTEFVEKKKSILQTMSLTTESSGFGSLDICRILIRFTQSMT